MLVTVGLSGLLVEAMQFRQKAGLEKLGNLKPDRTNVRLCLLAEAGSGSEKAHVIAASDFT